MKKLIAALAFVVMLVNSGLIYPACYIVTATDEAQDIVTVEACNGNVFDFYGVEDWTPGDLCACIMWSNGTEEVYDDEIIAARYVGIAEWFMEIYPNY